MNINRDYVLDPRWTKTHCFSQGMGKSPQEYREAQLIVLTKVGFFLYENDGLFMGLTWHTDWEFNCIEAVLTYGGN
jgi:hypothetical protein